MDDQFQVVHHYRKHENQKKTTMNKKNEDVYEDSNSTSLLLNKLEKRKNELFASDFASDFKYTLNKAFSACGIPKNNPLDVVCYGLGSCTDSIDASYQFALLLLLRDYTSSAKVLIYDPIFSPAEIEALTNFGLEVLEVNEEGKRPVDTKTIFFVPHCSKSLYNNLLWANWSSASMSNLIIIGNSFNEMGDSLPQRVLQERFWCLAKMLPAVSEFPIPNTFRFDTIFNSLSVHCFKEGELGVLDELIWNKPEELSYEADDELILCK